MFRNYQQLAIALNGAKITKFIWTADIQNNISETADIHFRPAKVKGKVDQISKNRQQSTSIYSQAKFIRHIYIRHF